MDAPPPTSPEPPPRSAFSGAARLPAVASSGLVPLDDALGGLYWGDNVVVRDAGGTRIADALTAAVIGADPYPAVVGISLGGTAVPGADSEDVSGLDLHDAIECIHTRAQAIGIGALIVIDDLAHAVDRYGVDGARRLFVRSCPALLRIGAVAYWRLGPDVPADLVEDIRRITQIVLSAEDERLTIVRAEARPPAAVGATFSCAVADDGALVLTPLGVGSGVGAALVAARTQRGLTQSEVARLAGVSPSAISQAERGQRGLAVGTLIRLANALGASLDELVLGSRQPGYRIRGRTAPHRGGASRVALLEGADEALRVYEFRLDPGAQGTPPARSQRSEAILLGRGLLVVTMSDGSTPVIREGEALFSGDVGIQSWRNLADDDAVGFWVGV